MQRLEKIVRKLGRWLVAPAVALSLATPSPGQEVRVEGNSSTEGVVTDVLRVNDYRSEIALGDTEIVLAANRENGFEDGIDYAEMSHDLELGAWELTPGIRSSNEPGYRLGLAASRDVGAGEVILKGVHSDGGELALASYEGRRLDLTGTYHTSAGKAWSFGVHGPDMGYAVWYGKDPSETESVVTSLDRGSFGAIGFVSHGDSTTGFLRGGIMPYEETALYRNGRDFVADLTRGKPKPTAESLRSYLADAPLAWEAARTDDYWQAQLGGTVWRGNGARLALGGGPRYDDGLKAVGEALLEVPVDDVLLDIELRTGPEMSVGLGIKYEF